MTSEEEKRTTTPSPADASSYRAPVLVVYGSMRTLTISGTGTMQEMGSGVQPDKFP